MATTIKAGNVTGGTSIASDGTGILELKTGTGSGTTALTLDASQNAAFAGTITSAGVITSPTGALYPIVSGSAITLTNQAAPEFTGIPPWAKRVTLIFSNVSTNGSSVPQIRLGAGSIDATSYSQGNGQVVNAGTTVVSNNPTTGFALNGNTWSSSVVVHGKLEFVLLDSSTNLWVVSGVLGRSDSQSINLLGGSKSLSGTLDRIRVTTVNGTDQYKSGQLNIFWE